MKLEENSNGDIVLILSPQEGEFLATILRRIPVSFIEEYDFIQTLLNEMKKCEE